MNKEKEKVNIRKITENRNRQEEKEKNKRKKEGKKERKEEKKESLMVPRPWNPPDGWANRCALD